MYKDKKVVVLITARGNSKRLPGKNIKLFCGKPLIAYSIDQGLASRFVDEVWVSSDDDKILKVSKKCGAKVLKRPTSLATSNAKSEDVVKHFYESMDGKPDYIVLLQPTSPLRRVMMIDKAISMFVDESHKYSSLMPLSIEEHKNGELCGCYYHPQGKKKFFFECGTIFIYKANMIREEDIYGGMIMPFIIDDEGSKIDIDTIQDFEKAEALAKYSAFQK